MSSLVTGRLVARTKSAARMRAQHLCHDDDAFMPIAVRDSSLISRRRASHR